MDVNTGVKELLSVPEAAKVLGISEGALRQRLHRGSIPSEKGDDGRVYVVITRNSVSDNAHNKAGESTVSDEITALLRQHNELLRSQLEAWQEESRRKDHIIAALTERIPELEAPASPERQEAPVTASEESGGGTGPEQQEPSQRRSWWRAFLGVE
jgi:hypothetical protein